MNREAFDRFVGEFYICSSDGSIKSTDETPSEVGEFIYNLVRLERPERVVEIGSHRGVTSAWIMRALDELGTGKLEAWETEKQWVSAWHEAMGQIWPDAVPGYIHQSSFHDAGRVACDMAFIDHMPKSAYITAFQQIDMGVGGIVLAHDLTLSGVERNGTNAGVWALYDHLGELGWDVFPVYGGRGLVMARKVQA